MVDTVEVQRRCNYDCPGNYFWTLSLDHFYLQVEKGKQGPFKVRASNGTDHYEDARADAKPVKRSTRAPQKPDQCLYPGEHEVVCGRTNPYVEDLEDPAVVGVGYVWSEDATGAAGGRYVTWAGDRRVYDDGRIESVGGPLRPAPGPARAAFDRYEAVATGARDGSLPFGVAVDGKRIDDVVVAQKVTAAWQIATLARLLAGDGISAVALTPDDPSVRRAALAMSVLNSLLYQEAVAAGRQVGPEEAASFARRQLPPGAPVAPDTVDAFRVVLTVERERRLLGEGRVAWLASAVARHHVEIHGMDDFTPAELAGALLSDPAGPGRDPR